MIFAICMALLIVCATAMGAFFGYWRGSEVATQQAVEFIEDME